jgi:hypothetical protein
MAAETSPVWKRTLVWLKSKGKNCMVEEQSHIKQLSPNHVCKIGLTQATYTNALSGGYQF